MPRSRIAGLAQVAGWPPAEGVQLLEAGLGLRVLARRRLAAGYANEIAAMTPPWCAGFPPDDVDRQGPQAGDLVTGGRLTGGRGHVGMGQERGVHLVRSLLVNPVPGTAHDEGVEILERLGAGLEPKESRTGFALPVTKSEGCWMIRWGAAFAEGQMSSMLRW